MEDVGDEAAALTRAKLAREGPIARGAPLAPDPGLDLRVEPRNPAEDQATMPPSISVTSENPRLSNNSIA